MSRIKVNPILSEAKRKNLLSLTPCGGRNTMRERGEHSLPQCIPLIFEATERSHFSLCHAYFKEAAPTQGRPLIVQLCL